MAGMTDDVYIRGGIPQSRYCGGCAHYQTLSGKAAKRFCGARVCLYILDMNHSRGCPAGPGYPRWISAEDWEKTPIGRAIIRERRRSERGGRQRRKTEAKEERI